MERDALFDLKSMYSDNYSDTAFHTMPFNRYGKNKTVVHLPQHGSDETYKLSNHHTAMSDSGTLPPRPLNKQACSTCPQRNPVGLGATSDTGVSDCKTELTKNTVNNVVMSAIVAGGYSGLAVAMDKVSGAASGRSGSNLTALTKAGSPEVAAAAETLREEKALQMQVTAKADAQPAQIDVVARNVEKAETALEKAISSAKPVDLPPSYRSSGTSSSSSSSALITSKPLEVITNMVSQMAISLTLRTLGTCSSATSPNFQIATQYIIPPLSGVARGTFDHYLFGKSIGRCAINSVIVTGLEFAATAMVAGFK